MMWLSLGSRIAICVALAGVSASTVPEVAASTSDAVFDDFDGAAGASPDNRYWNFDVGHWGLNQQVQTYTNTAENVRLDGAGNLVIEALRSPSGHTSARLVTRGKVEMTYGVMSARIKLPSGEGISPAFWLLGSDIDAVGWPECGEVDIIETPDNPMEFHTTVHGPWIRQPPGKGDNYRVSISGAIADLSADFRTFWVSRAPNLIVVGVDDITLGVFTPDSIGSNGRWVFDRPMYAILNIAVGDAAAGAPSSATPDVSTMLVDWFRWVPA